MTFSQIYEICEKVRLRTSTWNRALQRDALRLLPRGERHASDDHAPCGRGKLPFHGFRLYNVWLLPGDGKPRLDNVSPLIRGVQRPRDDCLCLLA